MMLASLNLYNSKTKLVERFVPIDEQNVRMYVCGPTVYDKIHVGNARPLIVFDVLYRLLRQLYGEKHVTYVRNITDVDDKINARALRDFPELPLNEAIRNVTERTTLHFHQDAAALGCLPPTHEPRATDHIDSMVKMIQQLIARGHAYLVATERGREVRFNAASDKNYGNLSCRAVSASTYDFVLWKESALDQPGWSATFAGTTFVGRPGWHIECSAMSHHYLGETFDIHGGGIDLLFPHHENEQAQSTCAHGTETMANVWMHNEFVETADGTKLSKSSGNLHPVQDDLVRWSGQELRLALLMTHYRKRLHLTPARLLEARHLLKKWQSRAAGEPTPDNNILNELCKDLSFSLVFAQLSSKTTSPESMQWALQLLGLHSNNLLTT
jgi:cysteinyl-tRNA synthetase